MFKGGGAEFICAKNVTDVNNIAAGRGREGGGAESQRGYCPGHIKMLNES